MLYVVVDVVCAVVLDEHVEAIDKQACSSQSGKMFVDVRVVVLDSNMEEASEH